MNNKMRYVIDTNIFVSYLLFPNSPPGQVVSKIQNKGILLLSDATFSELEEVIDRPKFSKYFTPERKDSFLSKIPKISERIIIFEKIEECRDPKDDKFLEVAVNGKADCVISGDDDLLVLHPFRNIPILSAHDFLEGEKL